MREIRRFESLQKTAEVAAIELVSHLTALLERKPLVHLSVTGGTLGIATLAEVGKLSQQPDWSRIHVWWGDERFVETDSNDRNFNQAFQVLFRLVPDARLHPMPAADQGLDLDDAATFFAREVAEYALNGQIPFDLTLLGMGPDGHIASLFPQKPLPPQGSSVIAEADSPKPPPRRISFTYEAINNSNQIWFLVAGADKAHAVQVVHSSEPEILPAGRVNGLQKTIWFIDLAAAAELS
jgi:6-phosphogluconolactonase